MSEGRVENRRLELAITALLEAGTYGEAAAQLNVAESTLRRWAAQPEFAAAYRQARQQVLEAALAKLQAATGKAVDALVRILDGDSANAACRAAGLILEHAERAHEWLDLTDRVAQLEATLPHTVQPGAPPRKLRDRIDRLRFPSGCAVCSDAEQLAQALIEASQPDEMLPDQCPVCDGELSALIRYEAEVQAMRLRLDAPRLSEPLVGN